MLCLWYKAILFSADIKAESEMCHKLYFSAGFFHKHYGLSNHYYSRVHDILAKNAANTIILLPLHNSFIQLNPMKAGKN